MNLVSPPKSPLTLPERLESAKQTIEKAAIEGRGLRMYEVALALDMSEFHFARQFRSAFKNSPKQYYNECRAEHARALLAQHLSEGEVAQRVGLRRPAELRELLRKHPGKDVEPTTLCSTPDSIVAAATA